MPDRIAPSAVASATTPKQPALGVRVTIALAIGVFACVISWVATHRPGFGTPDFHWWWVGARALLDGQDPYETVPRVIGGQFRLFHPLPAVVLTIPLALLQPDVALSVFSGVSTAILAFVATRDSYHRLPMFLSASFAHAAVMGQWSLLLTAAVLMPPLAVLGAVKPNVGIAMLGQSLSWRAALAMTTFAALTLVLMPGWPREWLAQLPDSPYHFSPLRTPVGFLTLLALLKWRRPEARLLAILGMVPQSPFVYEALPLFLIPQTRSQTYALVIGSDLALGAYLYTKGMPESAFYRINGIAVVVGMYLPAVALVLRRPNEGTLPEMFERFSRYLPSPLRGRATPAPA